MLYFVQHLDGGSIKIGMSGGPPLGRIIEFRYKYKRGHGLRVLAVMDGNILDERALHKRFAHLRIKGEWFRPGKDLLAYIKKNGQSWKDPTLRPPKIKTRGKTATGWIDIPS